MITKQTKQYRTQQNDSNFVNRYMNTWILFFLHLKSRRSEEERLLFQVFSAFPSHFALKRREMTHWIGWETPSQENQGLTILFWQVFRRPPSHVMASHLEVTMPTWSNNVRRTMCVYKIPSLLILCIRCLSSVLMGLSSTRRYLFVIGGKHQTVACLGS